jgi:hypothetical protein
MRLFLRTGLLALTGALVLGDTIVTEIKFEEK